MKSRLQYFGGQSMKVFFVFVVTLGALFFSPKSYAEYSNNPRQTGEVVLDEILMGSNKFIIRTGSNGCTEKNSFKIDIKKEEGLSAQAARPRPHYTLTIVRIKPDECKMIVDSGVLIRFDLEKDLGLKGDYTYSVTNKVLSSEIPGNFLGISSNSDEFADIPQPEFSLPDASLFSIIEKYFTVKFPESQEIRPEPFEKLGMEHDYFTCYIPTHWKLDRDPEGDEKAGIFEISLTMPEKAKPEDGETYFFPDPFIYVGYYTKNNNQNKTYESFIKDFQNLALKREGSDKSHFEKPQEIIFDGKKAIEITYEVYQEVPRGPLFITKYWLKDKFIVIKAQEGFYVLAYKSPREFYDQSLPIFEEVTKSFKTLY